MISRSAVRALLRAGLFTVACCVDTSEPNRPARGADPLGPREVADPAPQLGAQPVTSVLSADPQARIQPLASAAAADTSPTPVSGDAGAGLVINATFDASIDAATRTVINNAIAFYQNTFTNNVTVSIYFYNMSSGLGASTTWFYTVSYSSFRTAIASQATSGDDATALANTPSASSSPVTGSTSIAVSSANGRAIGLSTPVFSFNFAGSPCPTFTGDSCIGLNVALANSLGDLTAVTEHEIDEALGLGSALGGTTTPTRTGPEDLFRWASSGVRSYAANASTTNPCSGSTPRAFFSIDGGATKLNEFNNCNNGGDYGDWITHTPSQVQDAFTNASASPSLTANSSEVRALDVIGYNLPQKAVMSSPTPGATLTSATVTFTWAGNGTEYWLFVGKAGGADIYNKSAGTNLSATVAGIPTDGSTINVRLYTFLNGAWTYNDYTYTAATVTSAPTATTTAASSVTSTGATLTGSVTPNGLATTVVFQWGATTSYGNTTSSQSIGSGTSAVAVSASLTGLTAGQAYHFRVVATNSAGTTNGSDQSFTTTAGATKATMSSPSPGSTLTSSTVTFSWTAGSGSEYWLFVGKAGGADIYNKSTGSSLSATVSGLPTDGSTVNVRLYTSISGTWSYNDYTYTASSTTAAPSVTTKAATSVTSTAATLNASVTPNGLATTVVFQWGTTTSYGTATSSQSIGSATSAVDVTASLTGLSAGQAYHFRVVATNSAGTTNGGDQTFTTTAAATKATMSSPSPGSTLSSSTVTFTWTAGTGTEYWLFVGKAGGADVYNKSTGTSLSATVSGIPTDGSTINVRLYTYAGGSWLSSDYTYTASGASSGGKAAMSSPTSGTTLTSSTVTFSWTAGSGTEYWLFVGKAGGADIYNKSTGTSLSATVSGIPTGGGTINVRLWTLVNGTWVYNDYTYTGPAGGSSGKATMSSPTPSTTLTSTTVTFQWTAGSGSEYWLFVGRAGGADIYNRSTGTNLSATISGMPNDGSTINVRLWTLSSGAWDYNDYTYTALAGTDNSSMMVIGEQIGRAHV